MKILFVSGTFRPRKFGGITNVSWNIISNLNIKKFEKIIVFTTDLGNDKKNRLNVPRKISYKNLDIYYFKNISNELAYNYRIYLPMVNILDIINGIRNTDIIHLHEYKSLLSYLVVLLAKIYNKKYILQMHGSCNNFYDSKLKYYLNILYDILFGNYIIQNSQKILVVSKIEKKIIKKIKKVIDNKFIYIPNGIEYKSPNNLNIKCQSNKILFLGRINYIKGIDILLYAFKNVKNIFTNLELLIVGPDEGYKNTIIKLIKKLNLNDSVKIIGSVCLDEKTSYFKESLLLVQPSRFEIFGIVPFEALLTNTPVIVSKNSGAAEIFERLNCNTFVSSITIKDLSNSIIKVINSNNEECINKLKIFIENNLRWNQIILKLEKIYYEV